jgi:hypothetical protein
VAAPISPMGPIRTTATMVPFPKMPFPELDLPCLAA